MFSCVQFFFSIQVHKQKQLQQEKDTHTHTHKSNLRNTGTTASRASELVFSNTENPEILFATETSS